MPLMKVIREDNGEWQTVEHLNFNKIGIGLTSPIILRRNNINSEEEITKIYADVNGKTEEIMYKTAVEEMLNSGWMPRYNEISTEMTTTQQKNQAEDIVNNKFNNDNTIKDKNLAKKTFLLEHRKLDGKEIFHILHYWNGSKWIALNNIWG